MQQWRISSNGNICRRKRIQYPNGDVYEGDYLNGRWNGEGTFISSNRKYVGSFKDGFFHGEGVLESYDRHGQCKYDGSFENGKRYGRGIFIDGLCNEWNGTWVNDAFTGQGQVTKANGETLTGEFKNGNLECTASIIEFANGDRYEGPCHAGLMDGCAGKYAFKGSQSYYEGPFCRGMKHGKGSFRFGDGSIYKGDFNDDLISGNGIIEYSQSRSPLKSYRGNWENGQFHGEGELLYDSKHHICSYTGSFAFSHFHGYGKLCYRDGFYEGDFKMDRRHGHGTRLWASGISFIGAWSDDEMVEGIWTDPSQSSYYIGTFTSNRKSGRGREIWNIDGNHKSKDQRLSWLFKGKGLHLYDGDYSNGNFDGEGKYFAPCGRKYEGSWKRGRPFGFGHAVLLSKDERGSLYRPYKYIGEWVDGRRHGQGTLYYLDGSTKSGIFVNGHLK